jgi:hypothetical protein
MADATESRWRALGALLIRRRVDLGYNKRTALARTPGSPAYSVLNDIEIANRTNFDATMIARIERTYKLEYGAIDDFLAGNAIALRVIADEAAERAGRAEFEREVEQLRQHARSMLALADRIGSRCPGDQARSQSAAG